MRRRRISSRAVLVGVLPLLAAGRAQVLAQSQPLPVQLRASAGVGLMVSRDQTASLGFDAPGIASDVQLGYALLPWLDVRLGVAGVAFPAERGMGALLQPLLGVAAVYPGALLRPWLQLDFGAGFTGRYLRPAWRASIGLDLRLSQTITFGPLLGYWHVIQHDGPTYTTDARFAWFGLAFSVQPFVSAQRNPPQVTRELSTTSRSEQRAPRPPPPAPAAPSQELLTLIEGTLPSEHNTWLAPVLFAYDSDTLEPQGVAMLHEVARELLRRPQLKRLEVRGYADARGSPQYNLALSERRARVVLEWLVAHGVQRERLTLAAHGAAEPVEQGAQESALEQNRRVVFRVLEAEEP